MRNNNSELLFDQTCGSGWSGGLGGRRCGLSSQLAKTNTALVSHNSLTLARTVIRYWFGLTMARRSSGLLSQPTVRRSVLPGASWRLLCKLYFSAVAALRRAAPWMLSGGSPFVRRIVLPPDEAIISPSPTDFEKLYPSFYYAPLFLLFSLVPTLIVCLVFFVPLFGRECATMQPCGCQ